MSLEIYLSLGSNLGDRLSHLQQAITLISSAIGPITEESSVYESEPWGFDHENTFLNQVIKTTSNLFPTELLKECLEIEKQLGRIRSSTSYQARTLDIDILFYGQEIIDSERLKIPHPQIQNRAFVLVPLKEIAPDLIHPILNSPISQLLSLCEDKLWVRKMGPGSKLF